MERWFIVWQAVENMPFDRLSVSSDKKLLRHPTWRGSLHLKRHHLMPDACMGCQQNVVVFDPFCLF
jgi:hypothetical protein